MSIPDVLYNTTDGSGFLLPQADETGASFLTLDYLEQNNLFGKEIEILHSWHSLVQKAIFFKPEMKAHAMAYGEIAPVGKVTLNGVDIEYVSRIL
jgi:hypothetical protein